MLTNREVLTKTDLAGLLNKINESLSDEGIIGPCVIDLIAPDVDYYAGLCRNAKYFDRPSSKKCYECILSWLDSESKEENRNENK